VSRHVPGGQRTTPRCVTLRPSASNLGAMPSGGIDRVEVGLNLGVLSIKGAWKPNEQERDAAWELYVELVTRVAVVPLSSSRCLYGPARRRRRRSETDQLSDRLKWRGGARRGLATAAVLKSVAGQRT
jgi:hypothetical protein